MLANQKDKWNTTLADLNTSRNIKIEAMIGGLQSWGNKQQPCRITHLQFIV